MIRLYVNGGPRDSGVSSSHPYLLSYQCSSHTGFTVYSSFMSNTHSPGAVRLSDAHCKLFKFFIYLCRYRKTSLQIDYLENRQSRQYSDRNWPEWQMEVSYLSFNGLSGCAGFIIMLSGFPSMSILIDQRYLPSAPRVFIKTQNACIFPFQDAFTSWFCCMCLHWNNFVYVSSIFSTGPTE